MQVKKDDVTSVSGPDGEIKADKDGVLTVPTALGEWLVRVHGFVRHVEAVVVADVKKVEEKVKPETAAQKKKREAADTPTDTPAESTPEDDTK